MSLSQWELFWWRTKLFTQPQPKYYAYQEELRNNPLIEHSINLITLVRILLIVVTIPTEGIWNRQWNSENMLTTGERRRGKWPRGRAGALSNGKEVRKGLIVSLISEDKCWQNKLWKRVTERGRRCGEDAASLSLIRPSSLNCCLSEYYV